MTTAGRQVLADCEIALAMLEEETNLQRWRIHWAGALLLIRTVGHVLRNVDGQEPLLFRIGNAFHEKWKGGDEKHRIFREFIEYERNLIAKEYRFNIHPLEQVGVTVSTTLAPVKGGEQIVLNEVYPIGENIYRPIMDGYYVGDDARDIYQEAIDWWKTQLDEIDDVVKRERLKKAP